MVPDDFDSSLWDKAPTKEMSKKEIRALIKIARSLQVFVHPHYYLWSDTKLARVETTKAWMTEFVAEVPSVDDLPGVQVVVFKGETYVRFWPPGTYNVVSG